MAFTKITHAGIGSTGTVLLENLEVTGVGTFGGNVTIGGTLTYEDVTNIDSVGLVTARNGIVVGSGITLSKDGDGFFTGIVTATSFAGSGANLTGIDTDLVSDTSPQLGGNLDVNTKNIVFGDSGGATDDRLTFGAGTDLSIYHDGSHSRIVDSGTGNLILQTSKININNADGTEGILHGTAGGAVELYHANSIKLTTTSSGVSVTGSATVSGDVSIADKIIHTGDTDTAIRFITANTIVAETGGTERLRIDDAGKVLIGASSGVNSFSDTFQIFQPDATAAITLKRASNNAYAPYINFIKSRGSTAGDATVLQSGDIMAYIRFSGTDGTDTTESATIQAVVDGTPGNNDMPGRLVFSTTADGSNASTERLRITSAGLVGIGENTPLAQLHIKPASNMSQLLLEQNNATDGYALFQDGPNGGHLKFMRHINGSETQRLLLRSDGGLCFGTDSGTGNALDDYEEGTFTPSFVQGYNSVNYNVQAGFYTKVGRFVSYSIYLYVLSAGGQNAEIRLSLPFTTENTQYLEEGAFIVYDVNTLSTSNDEKSNCYIMSGRNYTYLRFFKNNNGAAIYGNDTTLGTGGNNTYLLIKGFLTTAT